MSYDLAAREALKFWNRDNAIIAVAIAAAESVQFTDLHGDNLSIFTPNQRAIYAPYACNGDLSHGIWQIFAGVHHAMLTQISGSSDPCVWASWLEDYHNCARAAYLVWNSRGGGSVIGWQAWSVYNGGQYIANLSAATQAVDSVPVERIYGLSVKRYYPYSDGYAMDVVVSTSQPELLHIWVGPVKANSYQEVKESTFWYMYWNVGAGEFSFDQLPGTWFGELFGLDYASPTGWLLPGRTYYWGASIVEGQDLTWWRFGGEILIPEIPPEPPPGPPPVAEFPENLYVFRPEAAQGPYLVMFDWKGLAGDWWLDVADSPNFEIFSNIYIAGLDFVLTDAAFDPPVILEPGFSYFWRIWDGTQHFYGPGWTVPFGNPVDTSGDIPFIPVEPDSPIGLDEPSDLPSLGFGQKLLNIANAIREARNKINSWRS